VASWAPPLNGSGSPVDVRVVMTQSGVPPDQGVAGVYDYRNPGLLFNLTLINLIRGWPPSPWL